MSSTAETADFAAPDHLIERRGLTRQVEGHVVSCVFSRDGATVAYATGDGIVHLAPLAASSADAWSSAEAHDGAVLCLAADTAPGGFLTGGDDNSLKRIAADGGVSVLAQGRRWVEQVASFVDEKGRGGLIASSVGKQVELRDGKGALLKTLEHDSTVSGLAFDAKGKRIAASHYNGASIWFVSAKVDSPRRLAWKGSHIGLALHPAGDALVTAMQENELHGWRLEDGHNMRMSGYPTKTQSLSFSRNGRWLATSGADSIVLWPFFGGGPMGKSPTELAPIPEIVCTRAMFHPQQDIVAAGYADGTVLMSDVGSKRVLPICGPGRGPVSALAFSPDGSHLAFATETGTIALLDLSARDG